MGYCLDQAKNCCGEKDGDYQTKYGHGSHNKKSGSGFFSYGTGKRPDWKLTYYKDGDVGCLEFIDPEKYKKDSSNRYTKICWDTCDMCNQDLQIRKDMDPTTRYVLGTFNNNDKTNLGGGFCTWSDKYADEGAYGIINVFTGDGAFTSSDGAEDRTWMITDFIVVR